jgi:hypothetical protein
MLSGLVWLRIGPGAGPCEHSNGSDSERSNLPGCHTVCVLHFSDVSEENLPCYTRYCYKYVRVCTMH